MLDGLPDGPRAWLDELDQHTLEVFGRLDATLVHEQGRYRYPDDALLKRLSRDWGDAEWRAMSLWAQLLMWATDGSTLVSTLPTNLAQRRPHWPPRQLDLLWRTALGFGEQQTDLLYRIPISAVKHLPAAAREPLLPLLREAQRQLVAMPLSIHWQARRVLDDLLAEHPTDDPADAVRSLVPEGGGFAAILREEYGARLGRPDTVPILRHWAAATTANPTPAWTARAAELLTPDAVGLLREVLGRVPTHREGLMHDGYRDVLLYLHERTAQLLRGMIWTCEHLDEPWVTGLLGDLAVATGTGIGGSGANSRSELLANAALGVLGRRGGLAAVPQLARVQAKVRKKSILTKVARTLDAIAAQTGLSAEQLLERTVPTFGFGPDGTRAEAGLRLSLDGVITYDGRKAIPKTVDRRLLAEFRATAKELRKAVPAERFRIERALATERVWQWRDVCEFYLDHPVTGAFGRALIWTVEQGPAGLPVQVDGAWELAGHDGRRVRPEPDAAVRLWHPIAHPAGEVRAWRDHLMELGLRQPFKQAFREVYLLTPAEEETRDHSQRFARHLLRYGQAKALLTERGWTGMSMGWWHGESGSDQCETVKALPGGLTASWLFHLDAETLERDGYSGTASVCVSEELRILDADGRPVPLCDVPPLALSETLRDADLAVGVTSIGLDPEGHGEYWRSFGFGDLSESARVRRDALAGLLPRLAIAGRCTLTDRFLRVQGELRAYKIHLGSGNVLMEPNDAYLCIVTRGSGDRVFLPFEQDGGMLSVILSKAFLLAADTKITDPSITRQIAS
ncbi:DUF4132 domain-containing protein [Nonomuraea sp. NN258]|uniref:DUF4132 domain-containing protein n=1 Tax=Nonomuraea antri TaxID=2730852 RepID=UPI001567C797|nr:DUF4132 domain-containing protein [Nonomuraea antri]NRQ36728.1 DUF4132 domain-containing protein [Nonomuraea antri]